jgi:hypothetical protein
MFIHSPGHYTAYVETWCSPCPPHHVFGCSRLLGIVLISVTGSYDQTCYATHGVKLANERDSLLRRFMIMQRYPQKTFAGDSNDCPCI